MGLSGGDRVPLGIVLLPPFCAQEGLRLLSVWGVWILDELHTRDVSSPWTCMGYMNIAEWERPGFKRERGCWRIPSEGPGNEFFETNRLLKSLPFLFRKEQA